MIAKVAGTAQSANIPAPIGGWNARDALATMPVTDAIALDNWWPTTEDVRIRSGSESHATGLTGRVESLLSYTSPTESKLFAVASGSVHDVTSAGAVGAAVTTFSNSRIYSESITTAGGSFLFCCNGVDAPQHYNGTAWAVPAITGVTSSTLVQPLLFKSRLFFAQEDSLSLWYLSVNSIAGAATELALGGIFRQGGYILAIGSWSMDGGQGADDHLVVITSEGEAAVYRGTDPTSSGTWSLVGVYNIGTPVGRRCLLKFGGDLLIIRQDGIFPLSAALQMSDRTSAVTDKIGPAVRSATSLYGSFYGWELSSYPQAAALVMNVPVSANASHQYVMNTETGAWARFTGWNASCFAVFNDALYFGGNATVYSAWTGNSDSGTNIVADAKPAFSSFGMPARKKHFQMVKLYLKSSGPVSPAYLLNVDYADATPTTSPASTPINSGLWGVGLWGVSLWGGGLLRIAKWSKVNGVGNVASLRVRIATNTNEVRWYSTDFAISTGGIL